MGRVFLGLFAAALLSGQEFKPDNVKILGDLDYGRTSNPVECAAGPDYCAFVFNGLENERIEITVHNADGRAYVAIADGALTKLASGTDRVVFSLPKTGPDPAAYYIVFRDPGNKVGHFTVALKKLESK